MSERSREAVINDEMLIPLSGKRWIANVWWRLGPFLRRSLAANIFPGGSAQHFFLLLLTGLLNVSVTTYQTLMTKRLMLTIDATISTVF